MFNRANTGLDQYKKTLFFGEESLQIPFWTFSTAKNDCSTVAAAAITACLPSSSFSGAFEGRLVYVTAAQMSYGLMEYPECMLAKTHGT